MQTSLAMDDARVKKELEDYFFNNSHRRQTPSNAATPSDLITLSDSDDDFDGGGGGSGVSRVYTKRRKTASDSLPPGFLDPIPPLPQSPMLVPPNSAVATAETAASKAVSSGQSVKQFWKAGDYEGAPSGNWDSTTGGMDHIRVHPKFLHSNATSHKWALGAFAELLDNALDEVCNGATYVNIDKLTNKKDESDMLLIEDNGGGMDPDKMRQCMSLGYSAKSKIANTIGQYGNGFKTSTMRLGADVIVFSRSSGKSGNSVTQSIGLLSYTFLRSTGKEDIVVPILDYELKEREWTAMMRSSPNDWSKNVDAIVTWSPYASETELLQQFNLMKEHGTRIIIYNLWEDDQGLLELDFTSDRHDIQIRGVNRDEKSIQMAKEYPNSRHFLTYRHSLRSYTSILYLRLPPNFRMIIRGKDVEHHNIVNDMMMSEEVTYRPQPSADGIPRHLDMVAVVTIGFVKDAVAHIDVQGFNVYHKNRLIKPFWRVWNAAGSDGRGVIGVLEANFVEPAHDKQGFERTTVLSRLENKLVQMQKNYWCTHCHKIGYAPRRNKKQLGYGDRESSPEYTPSPSRTKHKGKGMGYDKSYSRSTDKHGGETMGKHASLNENNGNGHSYSVRAKGNPDNVRENSQNVRIHESSDKVRQCSANLRVREISEEPSSPSEEGILDGDDEYTVPKRGVNGTSHSQFKTPGKERSEKAHPSKKISGPTQPEKSINGSVDLSSPTSTQALNQLRDENRQLTERLEAMNELKEENCALKKELQVLNRLKEENRSLQERLKEKKDKKVDALERDLQLEKDKVKSLETKLHEAESKIEELNKEQESLIDIFSEERDRRDLEEETLRKRLRDASSTIEELRERVMLLDSMSGSNSRR